MGEARLCSGWWWCFTRWMRPMGKRLVIGCTQAHVAYGAVLVVDALSCHLLVRIRRLSMSTPLFTIHSPHPAPFPTSVFLSPPLPSTPVQPSLCWVLVSPQSARLLFTARLKSTSRPRWSSRCDVWACIAHAFVGKDSGRLDDCLWR